MLKADVIVVGVGLSGALAANALVRAGLDVLALDAGPRLRGRLPKDTPGFERKVARVTSVDAARWGYRTLGARYPWLRVRAVGGRSLLWGGWMDRPDQAYFDARRRARHPWPLALDELEPWVAPAERALGVRAAVLPAALARRKSAGLSIAPKREAVLPGSRRACTALDLSSDLRVVDDASVLRVLVDAGGTVRGVEAVVGGELGRIAAPAVVLAASPIETARILHQSPRMPAAGLGAALHDHLVAGAIAIAPRAEIPERREGEADPGAGLLLPGEKDRVRMTVEVRGPKPLESLDDEDLSTLGFTRSEARRRALFAVFAMAETDPGAARRVWFDDLRPDGCGRPMPVLEIGRLTEQERETARALMARVKEVARAVGGRNGVVHPIRDPRQLGDVGHETGTCPMGREGRSIVDVRGAVHGTKGLFIADASPFPGALDRHPSLTLAAYALRTADQVARELARG